MHSRVTSILGAALLASIACGGEIAPAEQAAQVAPPSGPPSELSGRSSVATCDVGDVSAGAPCANDDIGSTCEIGNDSRAECNQFYTCDGPLGRASERSLGGALCFGAAALPAADCAPRMSRDSTAPRHHVHREHLVRIR